MDAFKREVIANDAGVFRVSLFYDDDAYSPREWSNVSRMVLAHSRYDLPIDDDDVDSAMRGEFGCGGRRSLRAITRWLRFKYGTRVVLPVWGYDHGALALRAGARVGQFADAWDSGFAGIVFDTAESVAECMGETATDEDIETALRGEVDVYTQWSMGMFVGYVVERLHDPLDEIDADDVDESDAWDWQHEDSCWGIDDEEYARSEAITAVETAEPVVPVAVLAVQV